MLMCWSCVLVLCEQEGEIVECYIEELIICGLLFTNYFLFLCFPVRQVHPQTGQSVHQTLKCEFPSCLSSFRLLTAFGKSNIWHIWVLPFVVSWPWICVCVCLSPFCIAVWFYFVSPSFSPPTPPPCQACPRCSHTLDPSARCKEPSSPRSAPFPSPRPRSISIHHLKADFLVLHWSRSCPSSVF